MDPLVEAESRRDGRNVDPALGALVGEGAQQRAPETFAHPAPRELDRTPSEDIGAAETPTYYGVPVLKEPIWEWMIPAYFAVGGLAGGCAVLAGAAQAWGAPEDDPLVRRCRLVATGGAVASAGLLIADLGRPSRFLYMLRVFRPTSPMNMGTWVLTGFGAASGVAALPALSAAVPRRLRRVPRPVRGAARGAGVLAGLLGLPLVGYTGVLVSNTAVPVWQETRNTLPILFAFSGAVSAGALFDLWRVPGPGGDAARRFGLIARGAEVALSFAMHREAGRVERVSRPLRRGASGALLTAARVLVAASVLAELLPWRRRRRTIAGVLAMAGTLALRFGIVAAGKASARDPSATFELQRAGQGAAEVLRDDSALTKGP